MKSHLKFSKTASSKLQYNINTSIIFNYIREFGPRSRARISKDLKISAPAVSRVVDKLIEQGYIIETEKVKTKGGKRPKPLTINGEKGYLIGIDLGKQKLRVSLSNFNNEIVKKYQGVNISNDKDISEKLISELRKFISICQKEIKISLENIKAICIGIPAVVDIETGAIISAPLYHNWRELNLREVFDKEFRVPVFIENDVNLSALEEKYFGEGKDYKDFVFIEVSNGIGAGIIVDNQLWRGSTGSAGEIGFTIINSENLEYKVKNKGYLEKFASIEGIRRQAIEALNKGQKSIIKSMVANNFDKIESWLICRAAMKGDHLANVIIKNMTNFLSIAVINIILILNPQIIVLGGEICNLPEVDKLIINPIIEKVSNTLPFKIPEIKLSKLGGDSGIMGASYVAIEALLMSAFPYKISQDISI
jgi:predicted NBD/HSP70 family sugar kinase